MGRAEGSVPYLQMVCLDRRVQQVALSSRLYDDGDRDDMILRQECMSGLSETINDQNI